MVRLALQRVVETCAREIRSQAPALATKHKVTHVSDARDWSERHDCSEACVNFPWIDQRRMLNNILRSIHTHSTTASDLTEARPSILAIPENGEG